MSTNIISASILSADLSCLGEEVQSMLAAGADRIHIDVMDHHYVPNLTFGPILCQAIHRAYPEANLEVHLMVQPVDDLIKSFASAGAHAISFHPEASAHIDRSLTLIRDLGCQAGLVLNPATPLNVLQYVWEKLDFVLVMSVNPGFSGQVFIPSALTKIKEIRTLIDQHQPKCDLAVDGGIHIDNIASVKAAGANHFIMGSALFGQSDYQAAITRLRAMLNNHVSIE